MSERQQLQLSFPVVDDREIIKLLADGRGHSLTEIVEITGLDWREAMHILARLVLDDQVSCHPGFIYQRRGATYGRK